MRIVALRDTRTKNVGDLAVSPVLYADALDLGAHVWKSIDYTAASMALRFGDVLLLGGGGIAGSFFPWRKAFGAIPTERLKDVVAWGVGTNYHDYRATLVNSGKVEKRRGLEYPAWVQRIHDGGGLVGVRDVGAPYPWVPCTSCMMPQLEALRATEPTRDVVGYGHFEVPLRVPVHQLTNDVPLGVALAHLASADTIVTNSYHGAYWGALLGRKVVVVDAFSNRFRFMKHPPAFADSPADWEAAAALAVTYPAALEECRVANLAFANMFRARFGG